ncbi:OPT family small oligopeptide transporter [Verruconis gallopava]|uniref:OPT family small oligopeptide transporter n=1 Tax=Verruconis gallopava TaxID=253628 RepID=A0A0D2A1A2_9PEZI|nr:OPT family small oligopeptide transporter [Verruconis gallopava]KIW00090.1 OPT family small oligopeptide transporter [Verruconis gallopava]
MEGPKEKAVFISSVDVRGPVEELKNRLNSWDMNLPQDYDPEKKYRNSWADNEDGFDKEEENSPYEEVRAAVPNYDEDVPANTIRAWTLGLIMASFGASINTLFSLRQPAIAIGTIVAQLVSFAIGKAWERILPNRQFTTMGIKWNLNPGPFNVKEHSVIVVMAGVSFGTAYATDIILAQVAFYKQNFGIAFQLLLTITTQSIGYGIAGLLRKFLVYPAAMIWPTNLASVTLMHAMHEKFEAPDPTVFGGSMSRYRWFGVVFLASFIYYFIPGFLAQFLSIFAFMTWIYPQNPVINQLFGGSTGVSLIPITFDWTQITGFVGDPLIPPWHAIANTLVGVVLFNVIGAIALHFGGAWYARYLPISDSGTYDHFGLAYNTTRIVTEDLTLNETAYREYSPLFISTTFAISYGLSFATIASLVVYCYLHYRHEIIRQFKASRDEKPDIHMKLMLKYPEAPTWWYGIMFIVMLALSLVTVLAWKTEFAWWAFLIAVAFSTIMTLPIGIVQAITNQQIGLNVITEFLMGYMQPGKPLALMMFKTYGYITASQALGFIGDLKFGHYMKIPPRTMFTAQVVATILSCFIQIFVLNFALNNIEGICTTTQAQRFTCPGGKVFFSASIIWGLLGPQRIFSPGQVYSALLIMFPIGAALPLVLWYAQKRWPRSFLQYAMAPIILGGAGSIPPATPLNYLSWGIVGFIFQKVIRNRHFNWWSRLNYLTASGLDTGLAISTLVIFFVFTMNDISAPKWWGNDVVSTTMDQQQTAIQATPAPGTFFGPKTW